MTLLEVYEWCNEHTALVYSIENLTRTGSSDEHWMVKFVTPHSTKIETKILK